MAPAAGMASAVERELRHAIAGDVFERLAAGFADSRRRRGHPAESDLSEVFAGTLLLLARQRWYEPTALLTAD